MREVPSIDETTSFGKVLKDIRRSLQLTQREAAERLGVTTKEVGLFERDLPIQLNVKIKILRQVCPEEVIRT